VASRDLETQDTPGGNLRIRARSTCQGAVRGFLNDIRDLRSASEQPKDDDKLQRSELVRFKVNRRPALQA